MQDVLLERTTISFRFSLHSSDEKVNHMEKLKYQVGFFVVYSQSNRNIRRLNEKPSGFFSPLQLTFTKRKI